jgi:predicted nuclease with TOPRIM domain
VAVCDFCLFAEEDSRKLETLEDLLKRLEQGLAHLEEENLKLKALNKSTENFSSRNSLVEELEKQKVILLAQVEKLELQVQKINEMSVLDKQAARTCQHQLWKVLIICHAYPMITEGFLIIVFHILSFKPMQVIWDVTLVVF